MLKSTLHVTSIQSRLNSVTIMYCIKKIENRGWKHIYRINSSIVINMHYIMYEFFHNNDLRHGKIDILI